MASSSDSNSNFDSLSRFSWYHNVRIVVPDNEGCTVVLNYGGHATEAEALDEIVDRLVQALDPVAIYLFGSRARGNARPDSDFDLMVVTRPTDGEKGFDYLRAYAPLLGRGIACDVLPVPEPDFNEDRDDPTSLCFEAAHHGRVVYECR